MIYMRGSAVCDLQIYWVRSLLQFGSRPTVLRNPVAMVAGKLTLPEGPGLGIEIDREALHRVTMKSHHVSA